MSSITASAKDWIAALTFVVPAISSRPASKSLACVRIDPKAGGLHATDYEITATATLGAFDRSGAAPFLAHYRCLVDAIKLTTKGDRSAAVKLSAGSSADDGRFVKIEAAGYSMTIPGGDIADYPKIDRLECTGSFKVTGADLKTAIAKVGIAASTDDTLPILTTIQFVQDGGGLTLLATDRYRLAMGEIPATARPKSKPVTFLVKAKTASHIARRIIVKDAVNVEIINGGEAVKFSLPGGTLSTLTTDGLYPKIRDLFEQPETGAFEVERAPLLAAARVAREMSERYTPARLAFADGSVTVHFNEGLFDGSSSPAIKAERVAGDPEPIAIAFNSNYLVPALDAITGKTVRIGYEKPGKQVLFTAAEDRPVYRQLVMPVRLPVMTP